MATGQKLRGLVGQSMSGAKKALTPHSRSYAPGSYSWTVTTGGRYRFVLWGPGGTGNTNDGVGNGGGSGALVIAERALGVGQVVAIVVGSPGTDTTVTLPTGEVLTAGKGAAPTAGTASGNAGLGDTLLNGTAGATGGAAGSAGSGAGGGSGGGSVNGNGGSGAPGTANYRGGNGGGGTVSPGQSPGGGGAGSGTTANEKYSWGGSGLAIIHQVKMRR